MWLCPASLLTIPSQADWTPFHSLLSLHSWPGSLASSPPHALCLLRSYLIFKSPWHSCSWTPSSWHASHLVVKTCWACTSLLACKLPEDGNRVSCLPLLLGAAARMSLSSVGNWCVFTNHRLFLKGDNCLLALVDFQLLQELMNHSINHIYALSSLEFLDIKSLIFQNNILQYWKHFYWYL